MIAQGNQKFSIEFHHQDHQCQWKFLEIFRRSNKVEDHVHNTEGSFFAQRMNYRTYFYFFYNNQSSFCIPRILKNITNKLLFN